MGRRWRIFSLTAGILSAALAACGGGPDGQPAAADCARADITCVGLVTDVGSIKDKSFNQSSWAGVLEAVEALKGVGNFIETRDAKDYLANIGLFTEKRYDVVVTVGFGLKEATLEAARRYPAVKFIGVDQHQDEPLGNVAGLVFEEEKAGFMAGALGALLSRSGKVAAVLGTDLVPPVAAFKRGFEAGVRHVRPDIRVISTFHPGGLDAAFTDPEWGASTAKQAIAQGADVVFAAGGTTGNGGLIEAASHPGTYCIGVDTDQWETVPEARPCLVSSAVKKIAQGVSALTRDAAGGRLPSGNVVGEVGLAPFHDFEGAIPAGLKDTLAGIERGLRSGSLAVQP